MTSDILWRRWRRAANFALIAGVALQVILIWHAGGLMLKGYSDFAAFYTAGKMVLEGKAHDLYEPRVQWQVQHGFAPEVETRQGPIPYLRPPFEALIFSLFANLSYPVAFSLWTVLKILVLISVPTILKDCAPGAPWISTGQAVLVCFAFFPVVFDVLQGQDSIFLLFIVACAYRCMFHNASFRSGLVLGLGLIKFHLVIPIALVFLVRRKFQLFAGFAVMTAALTAISAMLVGWKVLLAYPTYLWRMNQARGVGILTPENMPNLRGIMTHLLGDATAQWLSVSLSGVTLLTAILATACLWRSDDDRDPKRMAAGFSLVVFTTILASFYANSYDMVILLIPFLLLGRTVADSLDLGYWAARIFVACWALLLASPIFLLFIVPAGHFYWFAPLLLSSLYLSVALLMRDWCIEEANPTGCHA